MDGRPPEPQWLPEHPVLEVLRSRRASGSVPGARTDDHRVALAVEGGGLRGVVSAGMLSALEDLGYKDAFDVVYGCSSGAVNCAYFLTGDTWYPVSIYYDDLASKRFLDFRRVMRRQPIISLDFALNEVVHVVKPLDYDAVLASAAPLHIMITDVDGLRTVSPADFSSAEDLRAALRASMWLPLAVRGTTLFRGGRAVDGGVLTAHPFMVANQDESITHILSLSTRPMGTLRPGVSPLNKYVGWRLNRLRNGLGSGYVRAVLEYKSARRKIEAERLAPVAAPYILDLAPLPGRVEVQRHEVNPWLLLEGARAGVEVVYYATEGRFRRSIPRLTIPGHDRIDFRFPVDHFDAGGSP